MTWLNVSLPAQKPNSRRRKLRAGRLYHCELLEASITQELCITREPCIIWEPFIFRGAIRCPAIHLCRINVPSFVPSSSGTGFSMRIYGLELGGISYHFLPWRTSVHQPMLQGTPGGPREHIPRYEGCSSTRAPLRIRQSAHDGG